MKSLVRASLGVLVVASLVAFAGCSDDGCGDAAAGGAGAQGEGGAADGAIKCQAIGELCHEVDDGDGPLHDCHEVGHVGNAAKCAEAFGECATLCLAAGELLEAGAAGAGGAGSQAGSHGGEASHSGGMTSVGGAAGG